LWNCEKDSDGKEDSGAGPSAYMLDYFVGMGFSKDLVMKAMVEAGTAIILIDFFRFIELHIFPFAYFVCLLLLLSGDRGEDSLLDLLLKYKVFASARSFAKFSLKLLFSGRKRICISQVMLRNAGGRLRPIGG